MSSCDYVKCLFFSKKKNKVLPHPFMKQDTDQYKQGSGAGGAFRGDEEGHDEEEHSALCVCVCVHEEEAVTSQPPLCSAPLHPVCFRRPLHLLWVRGQRSARCSRGRQVIGVGGSGPIWTVPSQIGWGGGRCSSC